MNLFYLFIKYGRRFKGKNLNLVLNPVLFLYLFSPSFFTNLIFIEYVLRNRKMLKRLSKISSKKEREKQTILVEGRLFLKTF